MTNAEVERLEAVLARQQSAYETEILIEREAHAAEVERLTAERDALVPVLEQIDLKAQAGLCYFTLESARAFLQDIRKIISAATQGSKP